MMKYVWYILTLYLNVTHPQTKNGETALHVAYKKGSHQVWRLLLDENADPNIKNKVRVN